MGAATTTAIRDSHPDTDEKKLWWERMARGQVGKDRFLVLCALKDGEWKKMGDIQTFVEYSMGKIYSSSKMDHLLSLMAVRSKARNYPRGSKGSVSSEGEGWLEKDFQGELSGISARWRIEPSVLPLLYLLLMGCPEENRCL